MRSSSGSGKSPGLNLFALFKGTYSWCIGMRMNFRKVLPKLSRDTQTLLLAAASLWESALGGFRPMKRRVGFALSLLALAGLFFVSTPTTLAGKGSLATITGSVKDDKGNPLA